MTSLKFNVFEFIKNNSSTLENQINDYAANLISSEINYRVKSTSYSCVFEHYEGQPRTRHYVFVEYEPFERNSSK